MSNRLGGLQGTSYLGTNANQPPNCVFDNRDPAPHDINYSLLDHWLNYITQNVWVLTSLKGNSTSKGQVANWVLLATGVGDVSTLTGNSGGAVPALLGNINIVGTGGVSVAGNIGTNTLTISVSGIAFNYTAVSTSPYTVTATDYYLGVNSSAGAITILLPNAPTAYRTFVIKDVVGSSPTHNITITTVGGTVLIDGNTTFIMNTAYESENLLFDGVGYQIY